MPDTELPLPIAAVVSLSSGDANALIADFATRQRAAGRRVRGLIQELKVCDRGCQVVLIDLDNDARYRITQDLGPGSTSCGLDPALIAEAGTVMRRIADEGAELAIFNRFGALEADGGGFAPEMLSLMSEGIPVLTVVPAGQLERWRHFTGGLGSELPASAAALDAWFGGLPG